MSDSTRPENLVSRLPGVADWRRLATPSTGDRPWGRWHHQYEAYEFATRYLSLSKQWGDQLRAALVRMPAGSGKTGIMGLIANYCLADSSVLIVVPSEFLTSQVCDDLNIKYWTAVGKKPPKGPKKAVSFVPSILGEILDGPFDPTVLVCTTQTLSMICPESQSAFDQRWSGLYESLRNRISAVLVDEGHREPARTWAKAVRSFGHPVLLFSATPYRNDLRMFRIGRGKDYRFSVRFNEAVESGVIRTVVFRGPKRSFILGDRKTRVVKRDPAAFVRELLSYYYGPLQREKPPDVSDPKVIIRCETVSSIRAVHDALIADETKRHGADKAQQRAIAVHEDFDGAETANRLSHVPRTEQVSDRAVFWIHQFKLTEGIDNPDFCVAAFYEPFANSRALVQQIGRIMRNPTGRRDAQGIVFSDPSDGLEAEWSGYLEFEKSPQDIIGAEDIVHAVREAQPKWYYASGRYRSGADFDTDQLWDDVRVPASARVYLRPEGFGPTGMKQLAVTLSEHMEEQDMVEVRVLEKSHPGDRHSVVVLHWEIVQSDRLEERGFFDIRLVASILYMNSPRIFYQGRLSLRGLEPRPDLELVEIDRLESLIPPDEGTLKQLSLVNCDLGDTAVRRRALGGRALEASAASLNDHLHFVSSVVCRDGDQPRYVGLRQSTVTDRGLQFLSLDEFRTWAETLSVRLDKSGAKRHRTLRRYARPVRTPRDARARHLLLDLADFREEFRPRNSSADDETFSEEFLGTACDVAEDGSFTCEIAGRKASGSIAYSKGRFRITSESLNSLFEPRRDERRKPSTFVSSPTVMRVVTDKRLIYSDGRFYSTARLHGADRVHDLDLIVTVPGLERIDHSEKGEKGKFGRNTWQPGSLFHHIDNNDQLFRQCGLMPDILVCDDLASEIADFIAVDLSQKKIALLHAKVFEDRGSLSAKAMHEVVAQAKKNLGFLDPAERINTSRGNRWDDKWRWTKGSSRGLPRIRRKKPGCANGSAILERIQKLLHSTSVQKEVWLVLGNSFSERDIRGVVLREGEIPYHWSHLLYLIHSCHASVTAIGARLRIVTGADVDGS